MDISIIIPTRNKASRLKLTLAALSSQSNSLKRELIIVDDGSSDETMDVIAQASEIISLRLEKKTAKGGQRPETTAHQWQKVAC